MVAYIEKALKSKFEGFKEFLFLDSINPRSSSLIMSMDGHLHTQSYQEGTSDPTRMNLHKTLRSMQQSIEGLARHFQSVTTDVEELKKGKSSAKMKKTVEITLVAMIHLTIKDLLIMYLLMDTMIYGLKIIHFMKVDTKEHHKLEAEDDTIGHIKSFQDMKHVMKITSSTYKSLPKKEDTPKVAFKDHSKPKVEGKGRLITDPTGCFKCNGVGHNAINCPTKRTLVFSEDLNGWIEKSDDDCQEAPASISAAVRLQLPASATKFYFSFKLLQISALRTQLLRFAAAVAAGSTLALWSFCCGASLGISACSTASKFQLCIPQLPQLSFFSFNILPGSRSSLSCL
ncbi:hypothetical protein M9H77_03769 [Catharanthus roseus]|uniref:Uncharacterized protein n=1 Tax=Catharanthus roseus TaxID=4058 RepID=A0ACC0CCN5_CATRO|nr:hypothetical protein M9H77_03769 [Catharanthus roseus]